MQSPQQPVQCPDVRYLKFLQVVQYTDTLAGVGKSPGPVHQAGDIGLRNEIGRIGGNAFVSTQSDADWFCGHVNYSGEAYRCPAP